MAQSFTVKRWNDEIRFTPIEQPPVKENGCWVYPPKLVKVEPVGEGVFSAWVHHIISPPFTSKERQKERGEIFHEGWDEQYAIVSVECFQELLTRLTSLDRHEGMSFIKLDTRLFRRNPRALQTTAKKLRELRAVIATGIRAWVESGWADSWTSPPGQEMGHQPLLRRPSMAGTAYELNYDRYDLSLDLNDPAVVKKCREEHREDVVVLLVKDDVAVVQVSNKGSLGEEEGNSAFTLLSEDEKVEWLEDASLFEATPLSTKKEMEEKMEEVGIEFPEL